MSGAAGLRDALRLVVILDTAAAGHRDVAALAGAVVRGGATMLQLRAKDLAAGSLADLTRRVMDAAGALPVVVNDRLDVALAAGAAGCHLGQDDLPIAEARRVVPAGFVLGGSAGTPAEARRGALDGADYLGIGPIHVTASKADAGDAIGPEEFARVREAAAGLPCVAIGGVTAADLPALRRADAAGIAVIGAVLGTDDVEAATRALRKAVEG